MAEKITVNRGADKTIQFVWTDADGAALPLTEAWVICHYASLQFSVVPVNLSAGAFNVKLEGTDPIQEGDYPFRVKALVESGDSVASPEMILNVC